VGSEVRRLGAGEEEGERVSISGKEIGIVPFPEDPACPAAKCTECGKLSRPSLPSGVSYFVCRRCDQTVVYSAARRAAKADGAA